MRGERGEDGVSVGEIGQKVGFARESYFGKKPSRCTRQGEGVALMGAKEGCRPRRLEARPGAARLYIVRVCP